MPNAVHVMPIGTILLEKGKEYQGKDFSYSMTYFKACLCNSLHGISDLFSVCSLQSATL